MKMTVNIVNMPSMDTIPSLGDKDEALIRLLQEDARASISNLARQLGVSRTAAQERLNRLKRNGVIQGFTVRLNPEWQRKQVSAFIALVVEPKQAKPLISALERMTYIKALWTVSGSFDLLAEATAPSTEDIDQLLDDVGELEGVKRTESSIVLSTKFERR